MKPSIPFPTGQDALSQLRGLTSQEQNPLGQSFLHEIAREGDTATAELLISSGADPNQSDFDGKTPLHEAAFSGHAQTVSFLLSAQAEINARTGPLGHTPLALAVAAGHRRVVQILLKAGADVQSRDLLCGATPLHIAAGNGDVLMIGILVKSGADPTAVCFKGEQPAKTAARLGHTAAAKVLQKVVMGRLMSNTSPTKPHY